MSEIDYARALLLFENDTETDDCYVHECTRQVQGDKLKLVHIAVLHFGWKEKQTREIMSLVW